MLVKISESLLLSMMIDIYEKLFDTVIVKQNWTMQLDTN